MSVAILLLGITAIKTMPIDIFPYIDFPVVSVVWNYNGISPDEMEKRIVTPFERGMTTTVNDIDTSSRILLRGGRDPHLFQPHARVDLAMAQIAACPICSRGMPPGFSRHHFEVRRLQRSGSATGPGKQDPERAGNPRSWAELHPHAAGDRTGRRGAWPVRRQAAANRGGFGSGRIVRQAGLGHGCFQRRESAEPDLAGRHCEDRRPRVPGPAQQQSRSP